MSKRPLAWLDRMLRDLREFSGELLEAGLTTPATILAGAAPTSLSSLLARIDAFSREVESALSDAKQRPHDADRMTQTRSARGASPSRSPADYVISNGRPLPKVWFRLETQDALPMDMARWLAGIAARLGDNLTVESARLSKQIDEATFARDGESSYALEDAALLDRMRSPLSRAARQLRNTVSLICTQAGAEATPVMRRPRSLPLGQPWQRLRRIAETLDRPTDAIGEWLRSRAHSPSSADIPFLYQRWCGVQILHAANRLGWTTASDPIGPLFLGGAIALRLGEDLVELWVEPRLAETQAARIGWRSPERQELTPDFLFVTGPAGNRDAFVLDATMTTYSVFLAKKSRYRTKLMGVDPRHIAGVQLPRRPLRAWAAAPVKGETCQVTDSDGFVGVIPIHGAAQSFPALDAWLGDVFRHAREARLRASVEKAT
jgi:hypothetical protein